jgi:hypothetical protein
MDNSNTVLVNDLINPPFNPNVAYNNSWLGVGGAKFPLFAQASYVTNLSDLTIQLSASNVNVGSFTLRDPVNNYAVSVADIGLGNGTGAVRALIQNLDSIHDSFTVGDITGKTAIITNSALNVFVTNPVTSVNAFITNPQVEITNDTGSPIPVTIGNTLTAFATPINPSLLRSFNNFGINSNAGFNINTTKIPVFAVRINPNSGASGYIRNYEILTNAAAGTLALGYTWVYNPSAIGGSYTWNTLLNSNLQYAIFGDQNGTPNSYSGGVVVHSGIVAESNLESGDEIAAIPLIDGSSPTILLMTAQRLDANGTANFWFTVDVAQN